MFPTTLPVFLKLSSGLLNASKFSGVHRKLLFFFLCYAGRSREGVRNEAVDKFIRLMEMAGAISPGLFGTRMSRILDCVAESVCLS